MSDRVDELERLDVPDRERIVDAVLVDSQDALDAWNRHVSKHLHLATIANEANARAEAAEAALRDERAVTRYLLRTTRDERGHYLTTDGMKKHEAAAREAVKL